MSRVQVFFLLQKILAVFTIVNAQSPVNLNFELSTPAFITNNAQIAGWTVSHGLHTIAIDNCNQTNCCNLTTLYSELINTTNGYIDPIIGINYPIYSVFGEGASNAMANSFNPQVNFPMAGNRVIRLNNAASLDTEMENLTRTITITNNNSILEIAFIISVTGAHNCCESPGFQLTVSTSSCAFLFNTACVGAASQGSFFAAGSGNLTTNLTIPVFSKWRIKRFDMSAFVNQNVVVSVTGSRCIYGAHYGYAYVDANLTAGNFTVNQKPAVSNTVVIPFCKSAEIKCPQNYNGYFWQGPSGFTSSSPNITVTTSGVYTAQLSANDPCTDATRTLLVIFTPPPAIFSSTSPFCPGAFAVLSYTGGGAGSLWIHNGATTNSVLVTPTATTTYTLISTDSTGCNSPAYFTQVVLPVPHLTISPIPEICAGDSIKIKASGAGTYSWNCSNGYFSTASVFGFNSSTIPAQYNFTLTGAAASGCTASTQFSLVTWPLPIPALTVGPSNKLCLGSTIYFSGSGGTHYTWLGPGNISLNGPNVSLPLFGSHFSGTYTLIVSDQRNCHAQITTPIQVLSLPSGEINDDEFIKCVPFCTELNFITAISLAAPVVAASWKLDGKEQTDQKVCFNAAGNHLLQLFMKDINGCVGTVTAPIVALPKPKADFNFEPKTPVENIDLVVFKENASGENIKNFNWYLRVPENIWTSKEKNPSYLFEHEGIYPLALEVTNDLGCKDTIVKTINVKSDFAFYIPNAFTPDGNEKNDVFIPVMRGVKFFRLAVFNRWGQLIFSTEDAGRGWDGTFDAKDCQEGEYTWTLLIALQNGEEKSLTGRVLLFR